MDINSQHHNLLGNQIFPNQKIFVFWRFKMATIANQNGRHMMQHVLFRLNKFKMATVAMVTKVQKMLNSNRTADPFET
jgi:uncharacterized protein (DUF2147 family)